MSNTSRRDVTKVSLVAQLCSHRKETNPFISWLQLTIQAEVVVDAYLNDEEFEDYDYFDTFIDEVQPKFKEVFLSNKLDDHGISN